MASTILYKNLTYDQIAKIVEEKILSKAEKEDDCLICQRSKKNRHTIQISKQSMSILHLVYIYHKRKSMDDKKMIFHTCMNMLCIAEGHLRQTDQRRGILLNKVGWVFENLSTEELSIKARLKSLLAMGKKDENTGCITYTGYIDIKGYGKVGWRGSGYNVHALSWMLHNGVKVPIGKCIRHKCTTKTCFNIKHLELGTPSENASDRIRDNTILRGPKNHNTKISEELAQEIKNSYKEGSKIARSMRFTVTRSIVANIDRGNNWDSSIHEKRTHKYLHKNSTSDQQKDNLTH